MPKPMKIKLVVDEDDLTYGQPGSRTFCPIAKALWRYFDKEGQPALTAVSVNRSYTRIGFEDGRVLWCNHTRTVMDYIYKVDKRRNPMPHNFLMEFGDA